MHLLQHLRLKLLLLQQLMTRQLHQLLLLVLRLQLLKCLALLQQQYLLLLLQKGPGYDRAPAAAQSCLVARPARRLSPLSHMIADA